MDMELAQQIAEKATQIRERRRAHRQMLVIKGMLYRNNNAASPQRVRLRNVSMTGVAFESQVPIETGTRCKLLIEMGPARLNWRVKVVCCGKMGDGGYYVGGQFVTNELEASGPANYDSGLSDSLHMRE